MSIINHQQPEGNGDAQDPGPLPELLPDLTPEQFARVWAESDRIAAERGWPPYGTPRDGAR